MTDRASHWERVYATKREDEVSWYQERPTLSLELIRLASQSTASTIIDIGGGQSRLADYLAAAGYHCVAVLDISANALEASKRRLGAAAEKLEWIVADVTRWQPARSYDVWHDRAAFHFLTDPQDRAAYVARLSSALRKNGQAIIGTFAPEGPEKCSGLPVRRYDSEMLAAELGPAFELLETRTEIHRTPWNSGQAFQFSRFRRV